MSVISLRLAQSGGTAARAELLEVVTAGTLQTALGRGEIVRHRRGVYGLPLEGAAKGAAAVGAVLSHRSAALHHDWGVLHGPEEPELMVSRDRRVPVPDGVTLRFRTLPEQDVDGLATTPLRTVIDCARDLPMPEALAVADSAVRSGAVTRTDLTGALLPRTGRARARELLDLASPGAANPFESGLRGLAVEATGPLWTTQQPITLRSGVVLHCDVGAPGPRVALEADSHEFHASRRDIVRDCHRYNEMTIAGWVVLRFAWEHVMFHPDWVREVIAWVVRQRVSYCSSQSTARDLARLGEVGAPTAVRHTVTGAAQVTRGRRRGR
ncbi:type IV toxin-antitoxin system AbiEi family antitoxin domain-containing protein [Janibacter sp. GS2]|uniref:type IV toxin-antitoxin system AbiEi family antitoxin domain-containing protein n=1 Tax=Janibacter sp. GS2 TaxID=3442646 RepID=UPI003EC0CCB4